MEFHRSAGRHGIPRAEAEHALEHCIVVVELDPEGDPPRLLVIGPARSGQLLEIVVLDLEEERMLVIHAMPMRAKHRLLLPGQEGPR